MDVSAILDAVMKAKGWSQEELAHQLDVGQSAVSHWLRGTRMPGGVNLERIRQLGIGIHVIPREGEPTTMVAPVMGRVGAGAVIDVEFEQPPPEGHYTIELPFTFSDPVVAFEIEGDSMIPAYEAGEVIVCLRDQVRSIDHYLGERVVVRLSTGQRYLKRLARGRKKGVYNLESWNSRTIEDVRIEWVGEIVATVNPAMVRRVERRHQQAKKVAVTKSAISKAPRKASANAGGGR